ncbi:MAG TPA: ribonuclease HII [Candidatus Fimimonas merdipullorum]|uniref:Ribonuclease HII n=1 Tax=Candidatus Fimimonas merdipullorum TaxID=2840822 RepID=A0A9D1MWM7_9BACT|nr:ribonuclease HII [Candidatus Fimimonas merdipullorum]
MKDMLFYERQAAEGGLRIAGMDEAGRGPLAGPVVVAAVVMPLSSDKLISGVDDSKKLSEKKREALYEQIMQVAEEVQVAFATHEEVDSLNVLNATKKAMLQCVNSLTKADKVLIDAVTLSAKIPTLGIIHGDALSYSIAAASIVAKVTRDRLMKQYDRQYPLYNFAKHKGYGTAEHIRLLGQYGACPIHRKTFIKKFVTEEQ